MKTLQKILAATAALLMAAFAPSSIQADTLALYNFSSGSVASTAGSGLASAGSFTATGLADTITTNGAFGVPLNQTPASKTAAIESDAYASFTLTPSEALDLTQLSFTLGLSNNGAQTYTVRVAVVAVTGSISTELGEGVFQTSASSGSAGQYGSPTVLDLTSFSATAGSFSEPVTFRFYFWDSHNNAGAYVRLDAITLVGQAAAVPEPAAAALVSGFAVAAIVAIRRRAGKW
ncbi:hypothetical protein OPIT5_05240 [Opitutaceae bacterium TAV5]|nr:hypothetical protein OPIT5_05240 [Opitutaceae bacterium TAV5]